MQSFYTTEADLSWAAMKADAKEKAGLQAAVLPVGVNFAIFDEDGSGAGMLDVGDAVKTTGYEDRLVVKDMIELVGEALEITKGEDIV